MTWPMVMPNTATAMARQRATTGYSAQTRLRVWLVLAHAANLTAGRGGILDTTGCTHTGMRERYCPNHTLSTHPKTFADEQFQTRRGNHRHVCRICVPPSLPAPKTTTTHNHDCRCGRPPPHPPPPPPRPPPCVGTVGGIADVCVCVCDHQCAGMCRLQPPLVVAREHESNRCSACDC